MGYGGRLMGAIAGWGKLHRHKFGCYAGLEKIRDDYGHKHKSYTLLKQGSETFVIQI